MKHFQVGLIISAFFLAGPTVDGVDPTGPASDKIAATETAPPNESPKEMMLRGARIADRFDLDGFSKLHDISGCSQLETDLTHASIKYAIEVTRIERALHDRFGQNAVNDFFRAIEEHGGDDVRQAEFKVDGDKATVKYADDTDPTTYLVRVKGEWKIDMHATLKDQTEAELKRGIKICEGAAPRAAPIAEKIKKGEIRTADEATAEFRKILESFSDAKSDK